MAKVVNAKEIQAAHWFAKRMENQQSEEEEENGDEEKFVNVNRKNQVPKQRGFEEPEEDEDQN